jgi:hypothetical protein
LGQHQVKIAMEDLAGNQAKKNISFSIVSDATSTIADINRAYEEKMIIKVVAKNSLISDLMEIKVFQERYGQRIEIEKKMREKAIIQCLEYRDEIWCSNKIGTIFNLIGYRFDKINQALIKVKYNLILIKLDLYLRTKWINQEGYSIIKEDVKYLLSKI